MKDERQGEGPDSSEPRGLRVNERVVIPMRELELRASRSSGPGGQHVNTSSTRVELIWNLRTSVSLDEAERARVLDALDARVDGAGQLRVVVSDTRSQRQNRAIALERLVALLRKALVVRRVRKRTRPHRGAVEERLAEKKQHGALKRERRPPADD